MEHIEIDCDMVQEKLQAIIINPSYVYVPSRFQPANVFKKALGKEFVTLHHKLGLLVGEGVLRNIDVISVVLP